MTEASRETVVMTVGRTVEMMEARVAAASGATMAAAVVAVGPMGSVAMLVASTAVGRREALVVGLKVA